MNDPFFGGSKRGGLLPPDVAGAIAAASTSVSSPAGGVNAGAPFFARQNQGSNIGVPYARLCPLSGKRSEMGLGRPPVPVGPLGPVQITETDDLRHTSVAFILGRRSMGAVGLAKSAALTDASGNPVRGFNEDDGALDGAAVFDFGFNLAIHRDIAPGIPGTERFQKLCSIDYLKRYFTNVLPNKGINLSHPFGTPGTMVTFATGGGWQTGVPSTVVDAARRRESLRTGSGGQEALIGESVDLATNSMLDVGDLCKKLGMADSAAANATPIRQGIFARDCGPFLRGKGIAPGLLNGTNSEHSPQEVAVAGGGDPVHPISPYHISRCAGDDLAFGLLERVMEANGLTDWRPDGIVLSKGVNDPSDKINDEALEARDGQLFNVRIQGPAVTSSWTGDPQLEVMPLDRVFVVIVADVWWGTLNDAGYEKIKEFVDLVAPPSPATQPTQPTRTQLVDYMKARNSVLAGDQLVRGGTAATAAVLEKFKDDAKEEFMKTAANCEQTRLCNFRVELATSAQMVSYSHLRFDQNGNQVVGEFETNDSQFRRVPNQSRMGLRLGIVGGEYIVGGWCIGSVLDTCASRAVSSNSGVSTIGVRTAPNSMAININVGVEWWDPDRMWRSYMNVDESVTPRYIETKSKDNISAINRSPLEFQPSPNPKLVITKAPTAGNVATNDLVATNSVNSKDPNMNTVDAVKEVYKNYLKKRPLAYDDYLAPDEVDALFT